MSSSWSLTGLREQNQAVPAVREVIARTGPALQLVETPGEHADATTAATLEGVFASFNTWTEINDAGGRYLERISPGAFRKTISETGRRVPVLLHHGRSTVLGSLPLGRLASISEDAEGAKYMVRLNAGLPELLIAGLKDGQFGSSFRAQALQSRVNPRPKRSDYNPAGLPEVVRTELRLLDLGPTSMPAYGTTTAKVRSRNEPAAPTSEPEPEPPYWQLSDRDNSTEPYWQIQRKENHGGRIYALAPLATARAQARTRGHDR